MIEKGCYVLHKMGYVYSVHWTIGDESLSCSPLSLHCKHQQQSSGTARLGRLVIYMAEPKNMGPLSKSTTVSKAISKKAALIMRAILGSKRLLQLSVYSSPLNKETLSCVHLCMLLLWYNGYPTWKRCLLHTEGLML